MRHQLGGYSAGEWHSQRRYSPK
ncbi:hypothetical protein BDFB_013644 [Asbolus verrucosus]|uniref:Uncharacterized protein n=1 Tax=Asbolus verrucosus TaxID=1661398 RepID=A0A482VIB3_ASBVE|nr:hypothetical protein BDFB_013644 [Asbolus verrucosus]